MSAIVMRIAPRAKCFGLHPRKLGRPDDVHVISSASRRAVAGAACIPSEPCPPCTHRFSSICSCHRHARPGVIGRRPHHARVTRTPASAGETSSARRAIRSGAPAPSTASRSEVASEAPMSACPPRPGTAPGTRRPACRWRPRRPRRAWAARPRGPARPDRARRPPPRSRAARTAARRCACSQPRPPRTSVRRMQVGQPRPGGEHDGVRVDPALRRPRPARGERADAHPGAQPRARARGGLRQREHRPLGVDAMRAVQQHAAGDIAQGGQLGPDRGAVDELDADPLLGDRAALRVARARAAPRRGRAGARDTRSTRSPRGRRAARRRRPRTPPAAPRPLARPDAAASRCCVPTRRAPIRSCSSSVTSAPRRASSHAIVSPAMPPPTTTVPSMERNVPWTS